MTKATDTLLGELHGKLAKSMLDSLDASNKALELLETFEDDLPAPVAAFLDNLASANPALLTAIAKFLKDNNITCAIEDSEEMSDLQRRLHEKRKRIGNVVPISE